MAFGIEHRQTIFALASGRGKAGIAIIRVSGPRSAAAVKSLTGSLPPPRRATVKRIANPAERKTIDDGVILWFPGPHSFTGEDCAEFQVHGSRPVVQALLQALAEEPDMRPAQAGEFARRAFLNGRLDLTEVEALGDLIDAETEQQRRQAVGQLGGNLRRAATSWRERLIEALVLIESELDFADEVDAPKHARDKVAALASGVRLAIDELLIQGRCGERLREGLAIVIAGPPNAGKSTLLNALAQRDVAIVSENPGTTRDLIEVHLDLDGFPVTLIDTAGVREAEDAIEREGVRRALERAGHADLVLWLDESGMIGAPPRDLLVMKAPIWRIASQIDRRPGRVEADLGLSAKTGENMQLLIEKLTAFARDAMGAGSDLLITRVRHRAALEEARQALSQIEDGGGPAEILAEDLRQACYALESLVGKVGVEDVLDALFSQFCIGK